MRCGTSRAVVSMSAPGTGGIINQGGHEEDEKDKDEDESSLLDSDFGNASSENKNLRLSDLDT